MKDKKREGRKETYNHTQGFFFQKDIFKYNELPKRMETQHHVEKIGGGAGEGVAGEKETMYLSTEASLSLEFRSKCLNSILKFISHFISHISPVCPNIRQKTGLSTHCYK